MLDWAPIAGDMDREPLPPPDDEPDGDGTGLRGDTPGWGVEGGVPAAPLRGTGVELRPPPPPPALPSSS